jgi:hypothetical protein
MAENKKSPALLLRLTPEMIETLDELAHALKLSRTAYVGLCLARGVGYSRAVELPQCARRLDAVARQEMVGAG